jgi:hypothetical protein
MSYCAFAESQTSATHHGEQTKFFGNQVAGDNLEGTTFPKGDTLFEMSVF